MLEHPYLDRIQQQELGYQFPVLLRPEFVELRRAYVVMLEQFRRGERL